MDTYLTVGLFEGALSMLYHDEAALVQGLPKSLAESDPHSLTYSPIWASD